MSHELRLECIHDTHTIPLRWVYNPVPKVDRYWRRVRVSGGLHLGVFADKIITPLWGWYVYWSLLSLALWPDTSPPTDAIRQDSEPTCPRLPRLQGRRTVWA